MGARFVKNKKVRYNYIYVYTICEQVREAVYVKNAQYLLSKSITNKLLFDFYISSQATHFQNTRKWYR